MTARWTFMVYLAGFNNLSPFALKDIGEMQEIGASEDVQIALFVERQEAPGARYLTLDQHGAEQNVVELGDPDSGSPQTLVDFVEWAAGTAPAERYALVIWNHGGGWAPDALDSVSEEVRARNGAAAPTAREVAIALGSSQIGRALFKPTVGRVLELTSPHERMIAIDDGSGHSIDTVELGRALARAAELLGGPLELLGMDACLMSNLEVAYEVRRSVRHIVGSEEVEPGDGWPYAPVLRSLTEEPGMTGARLGSTIVDEYVASYQDSTADVTQCAVGTAEFDGFVGVVEGLVDALMTVVDDLAQRSIVIGARARATTFTGELMDLHSFCTELMTAPALDAGLRRATQQVLEALEPGGFVIAEGHHGKDVEGVGGVTLYFPRTFTDISPFYGETGFAKDHRWDEFLERLAQAVRAG